MLILNFSLTDSQYGNNIFFVVLKDSHYGDHVKSVQSILRHL